MRRRAVGRPTSLVSALLALGLLAGTASAQEECSTTSYAGPPLPKAFKEDSSRVWPKLPDAIFFNLTGSTDHAGEKATTKLRENVEKGLKMWTDQCTAVPATAGVATTAPEGSEAWTIVRGTYDQILKGNDPTDRKGRGVCGFADKDEKLLHVYVGASECRGIVKQVIGHEMGHSFRIGHASSQCSGSVMRTDLKNAAVRVIRQAAASDCEALDREELRRDCAENPNGEGCGGGGPDPDRPNPGPGDDPLGGPNCDLNPNDSRCPANCSVNPNHPDCDSCILNPNQPKCEDVSTSGCVWWPVPGLGWACIPMAPPPGGVPGDRSGTVTQTSVSGSIDYRIHLDSPGMVTAELSGMSEDFDCRLAAGEPLGGTPPPAAASGGKSSENCTNRTGAAGDTWSGLLPAGAHKLTVYPNGKASGDYTLSVSVTPVRSLPFTVSETAVGGDRVFRFALMAKGKVKLALTGMDRDMDCRVNSVRCSNRGGTHDDSWSGSLEAGVHAVTVYPFGGGTGAYTLSVTAESVSTPVPPAPVLSGTVSGRKQSLSWTAPATGSPFTRYQLQLREPSSADWYFTSSGSPSPSSNIDPKVTAWSVTTRAGMVLRYRVRATNAGGDGAWSNVVELTSESAARTLPFTVSETNASGERTYTFALSAETKVNVSLTGMDRDMDCRVGSSDCTNRRGTLDDSWSGTLAAGSHAVTVFPYGGGSGSYTLKVSVAGGTPPPPPPANPPAAPSLTGTVAGRTQTLNWSAPSSVSAITRYQLQTRASTSHSWRFTTAGSPSPSSNIGASARSWSITTAAGLTRQYRLRATSSHGDGAWSNVVTLTTPAAPPPPPPPTPPPVSVPAIPNFRLPSAGVVNTVFPAASGGRPPYRYGVSGLPPGITFFPSTRGARGTLPTVRRSTTYRVTYTATDSAGASDSVAFTATVVPP